MGGTQKLSHDPVSDSQMGQPIIPSDLAYKLGQLVNGLAANTETVSELVRSIGRLELSNNDLKKDFAHLAGGLEKANDDIMSLTKSVALLSSSLSVDEDTKKDMVFVRTERIASERRKPISMGITIAVYGAVITVIVVSVGAWIYTAAISQMRIDLKPQQAEMGARNLK